MPLAARQERELFAGRRHLERRLLTAAADSLDGIPLTDRTETVSRDDGVLLAERAGSAHS